MSQATFDPAKRLDIFFRLNRDGRLVFNFFDVDGNPFVLDSWAPEFLIKHVPESATTVYEPGITQTDVNQWTVDLLLIDMAALTPPLKKKTYFWELNVNDGLFEKTWFTGDAKATDGIFNGLDVQENSFTVMINGAPITVVLSDASSQGAPLKLTTTTILTPGTTVITPPQGSRQILYIKIGVFGHSGTTFNINIAASNLINGDELSIFLNYTGSSPGQEAVYINFLGDGVLIPRTVLNTAQPAIRCMYFSQIGLTPITRGKVKIVSLSSIGNSTTVYADTDLSLPIGFNFWTKFKFVIMFTSAATNNGIKFRLQSQDGNEITAGFLNWWGRASNGAAGSIESNGNLTLNSSVLITATSQLDGNIATIEGTVRSDGGLTLLKLQVASNTNAVAVQTRKFQSYVEWEGMFDQFTP